MQPNKLYAGSGALYACDVMALYEQVKDHLPGVQYEQAPGDSQVIARNGVQMSVPNAAARLEQDIDAWFKAVGAKPSMEYHANGQCDVECWGTPQRFISYGRPAHTIYKAHGYRTRLAAIVSLVTMLVGRPAEPAPLTAGVDRSAAAFPMPKESSSSILTVQDAMNDATWQAIRARLRI